MQKIDKIQRIEYLTAEQQKANSLLAQNQLLGNKLSSVAVGDSWDLKSPQDIGKLLYLIDGQIDENQVKIYSSMVDDNASMADMGIRHSTDKVTSVIDDTRFYSLLGAGEAIAKEYATRVGIDGKRLSERIWTPEERKGIFDIVAGAVKENLSPYELAERLQKYVTEDRPRWMIDRLANTELINAYTQGKKATYDEFIKEFSPQYDVVVDIELSPFHPKSDICDLVAGRYYYEDAPDVPIHPHCICSRVERIVPANTNRLRRETVEESIYRNSRKEQFAKISIPEYVGNIKVK